MLNSDAWWPVARSEEVTATKPFSVDIGDQPIVLWRDAHGIVRALEDRCPHRRSPLSLGCVKPDGTLQCGYHGWTYDGETGRLIDIPNMKGAQKYPPIYKALAFGVAESGGFVRVSLNAKATAPAPDTQTLPLSGTAHVALGHAQYLAALYDDPGIVLGIRGVSFTPYLMSELHEENGKLVMERNCQFGRLHWPAPFSPEFPATLLTSTDPLTGETELVLRDSGFKEYLRAVIAPVPGARGTTQVRWRAQLGAGRKGLHGILVKLSIYDKIDAASLRVLKPSASLHGADLLESITHTAAAIAA
jgi:nitrite reductase/ring-hydroxylating ferredoxin subunit